MVLMGLTSTEKVEVLTINKTTVCIWGRGRVKLEHGLGEGNSISVRILMRMLSQGVVHFGLQYYLKGTTVQFYS